MSSEREKLIEIWLDSAGERQYQFAFRDALMASGYTVLHNTSHTALELGKDVIARDKSGALNAYQLKGNPGGRLTIGQWHELIPQINVLVYSPVSHPSIKAGTPHSPFLVTNGEIHEDVYAAIAQYNSQIDTRVRGARPLKTMARGELLELVQGAAANLWPVNLDSQRNMLNIFAAPGNDEFPLDQFNDLLATIFPDKYLDTAIPAANLVTAILASNWIRHENHFELIKMYSVLACSVACYQSRWKRQRAKDQKFLQEIVFDVRVHIKRLIQEIREKFQAKPLINDNIFDEFGYYHVRKKMICGVASIAFLDEGFELSDDERDFLRKFLCNASHKFFLLWEGIIPFCVSEMWALAKIQGTMEPDRRLIALLGGVLQANDSEDWGHQLPSPYYSLAEVVEWKLSEWLGSSQFDLSLDSHYRRSWFAEPLFYLLARRNWKQTCRLYWPLITKFVHQTTRIPNASAFGPLKCDGAVAEDRLIDITSPRTWAEVVEEASKKVEPTIPPQLMAWPWLILLYCLFVPYRMTPDVLLWLDRQFGKTWY
jgi:hypothetical protein